MFFSAKNYSLSREGGFVPLHSGGGGHFFSALGYLSGVFFFPAQEPKKKSFHLFFGAPNFFFSGDIVPTPLLRKKVLNPQKKWGFPGLLDFFLFFIPRGVLIFGPLFPPPPGGGAQKVF